jgi:hypothetical protein
VNTIQFEALKSGLRQSKDGYMLTLAVHPDELPDDLTRDFIGSRYMVVMVRIGDDERPIDRESEFPGDTAIKMAGVLCRDPEFWAWLTENEWLQEQNEEACTEWLRSFLGIDSRKELKHNSEARELFNNIRRKFESWQKS